MSGRAAVAARRRRPGRLAVAVPARRAAGDRPRCRRAVRADRAARGRDVADATRERAALVAAARGRERGRHETTRGALDAAARTWLLAVVYFTIPVTLYGIGFWLPQMIKTASGGSDFEVGLLSAIPYAAGAVAMVIAGRHSDRTGERRWHVAGGAWSAPSASCRRRSRRDRWRRDRCRSRVMASRRCSVRSGRWRRGPCGVGAAAAIALIKSSATPAVSSVRICSGAHQRRDAQFRGGPVRHRGVMLTGRGVPLFLSGRMGLGACDAPAGSGRVRNAGAKLSRPACRNRAAASASTLVSQASSHCFKLFRKFKATVRACGH